MWGAESQASSERCEDDTIDAAQRRMHSPADGAQMQPCLAENRAAEGWAASSRTHTSGPVPPPSTGLVIPASGQRWLPRGQAKKPVGSDRGRATLGPITSHPQRCIRVHLSVWAYLEKELEVRLRVHGTYLCRWVAEQERSPVAECVG